MELWKKLFVGFGVVLLLTGVVAFVGFNGLNRVARSVEIADDANRMVRDMLTARRQEKSFMLRGFMVWQGDTQNAVEKLNDVIAELEVQIEETMAKFDEQEDRDALAEAARYVAGYKAAADRYVGLQIQKEEADALMVGAARAVLKVVEEMHADQKEKLHAEIGGGAGLTTIQERLEKADDANRLIRWMLEVRRQEKNYILRGEQQYADKVTTQIDEVLALLEDMRVRFKDAANCAQADEVIANLQSYEEAFESYTHAVAQQNEQERALIEAARGAIEQVEDLRASQKEAMLATQSSAGTMALGAAGIALLVGIGATLLITRAIAGPVTHLQRAVEQIAEGDLQVSIDIEQGDEIGRLAAAFKQMVQDLRRSEKREKHLSAVLRAIRNVNQLIVQERDRNRLLQGACDTLIATRGYDHAWIALVDESGGAVTSASSVQALSPSTTLRVNQVEGPVTVAEAGLGRDFMPLVEQLARGELPDCGLRALEQSDVVVTRNPPSTCGDCALSGKCSGRGGMTRRLEHSGKIYGVLMVSLPADLVADEEEQILFREVVSDIALALDYLELEEERKLTQEMLRESEERYLLATTAGQVGIWDWNLETNEIYLDPNLKAMLGYADEGIRNHLDDWTSHVHADDVERVIAEAKAHLEGLKPRYEVSHRKLHKDGSIRWFLTSGTAMRDADGKPYRMVGTDTDITELKQAQEALERHAQRLHALAARLAQVQEAERKRLAQELHDRVGQSLTALGINLSVLRTHMPQKTELVRSRLDDSLALVEQTTISIRDVMAELRPVVLDDYGLVPALRWYRGQLASRSDVDIAVEGEELVPRLDPSVANALFRIAQEALTNVIRHAQATRVTVYVQGEPGTVRLVIEDDGVGFDPARMDRRAAGQGWGLLNMSERARGVGGRCRIESQPGSGTRVIVEVPR